LKWRNDTDINSEGEGETCHIKKMLIQQFSSLLKVIQLSTAMMTAPA